LKVWIPVIVALITAVATLAPCLLTNDAKQQAANDKDAVIARLERDKAFLAGKVAALEMARPQSRRPGRAGAQPEPTKTVGGETIRVLVEAESSAAATWTPPTRRTWLRRTFAKQPGSVPERGQGER